MDTSFVTPKLKQYVSVRINGMDFLDAEGKPTEHCLTLAQRGPDALKQLQDRNFWPEDIRPHRVLVYNAIVQALPEELRAIHQNAAANSASV